ncbi:MAG: sigma-70 family RNA polymerase sigma factor [Actinomycetia bacterium]|nr:sigma-70 family RNA polymerase sigma factor [Actinomycetes bacterium]
MAPVDEAALIEAAQAGDRSATDQLLRAHQDRIYAVCRRLAGNDADALDATQEALIAIVRGLSRFDGRARFSTWAYRVATNACLDELRRRKRRPDPGLPEFERPVEGGAPSLDSGVADRLDLDAALVALPEEFRAPVILRDQLGLDYAEIAATLEIPPGTVRSRIARGRRHLAELLGNQDDVSDVTGGDHG